MTSSHVRGLDGLRSWARRFTVVCPTAHVRGTKTESWFFFILEGCFSYYIRMIQGKSTGVQGDETLCFSSRDARG